MRGLLISILGTALLALAACGRETYSQDTPEAVLASARAMVENRDAEQLHRLIYADNPEMREVLRRIGVALGNLQDLSFDVARAYPEEVEKYRKEIEAAAARGETTSALRSLAGGQRSRRTNQGVGEDFLSRLSKQVFADPYGFITRSEARLTTVYVTDDVAAIQWDAKPLWGLTMTRDKGRWYIVLPTNLPGVSEVMPRNRYEYSIWGSLAKAINNTITDVRADVNEGRAKDFEELARLTGEKAVVPAGLCMLAYGKAIEERRKEKEAKDAAAGAPGR